ncbi:DUF2283 domain-containing protein [Bacillus tequilensis]|uniref:DUF2283 domain-containing protein n=1 Tax=Bacillus tequilensis TaxID=227866 RepID=UPI0004664B20|nr:DUF2283 domain-containing protein [Bacillus tequilensis]MDR4433013.1 DUF2283 domain-containing protein [Bacillus tequilensis]SPU04622.1 Uncharacterized conserved small protein [Bacillus tequilensis]
MYSNSAITYDKEAELAYIYVIPPINQPSTVKLTEDLEVNENISLDINKQNLIVGMEIFGELANDISKLAGSKKIYKKTARNKKEIYSFRLYDLETSNSFEFNGILFCFADDNYEKFLGYDVIDIEKYKAELLNQYTI